MKLCSTHVRPTWGLVRAPLRYSAELELEHASLISRFYAFTFFSWV